MFPSKGTFFGYKPFTSSVSIADGQTLPIIGYGFVQLQNADGAIHTLKALHVPQLTHALISFGRLFLKNCDIVREGIDTFGVINQHNNERLFEGSVEGKVFTVKASIIVSNDSASLLSSHPSPVLIPEPVPLEDPPVDSAEPAAEENLTPAFSSLPTPKPGFDYVPASQPAPREISSTIDPANIITTKRRAHIANSILTTQPFYEAIFAMAATVSDSPSVPKTNGATNTLHVVNLNTDQLIIDLLVQLPPPSLPVSLRSRRRITSAAGPPLAVLTRVEGGFAAVLLVTFANWPATPLSGNPSAKKHPGDFNWLIQKKIKHHRVSSDNRVLKPKKTAFHNNIFREANRHSNLQVYFAGRRPLRIRKGYPAGVVNRQPLIVIYILAAARPNFPASLLEDFTIYHIGHRLRLCENGSFRNIVETVLASGAVPTRGPKRIKSVSLSAFKAYVAITKSARIAH
ncbi:hypothetical protein KEM48_004370 [Puccinia striiformis f. sp. tritici PST-130]|nr:hypothetical protein KEM48_004370 [Puccinia striiformis f. sp. tritici PST-130]